MTEWVKIRPGMERMVFPAHQCGSIRLITVTDHVTWAVATALPTRGFIPCWQLETTNLEEAKQVAERYAIAMNVDIGENRGHGHIGTA